MKKFCILLSFCSLFACTGCIYRAPTNDDICVVPSINNPHVTRERPRTFDPRS